MTETMAPARADAGDLPQPVEQPGWSFLRSKRWFGYFTLFVIFSIACVFLGNWQFDRRAEARAEIERIDANYEAAPAPLPEELPDLGGFDEDAQKWRPVVATGEYVGDPFLARNRPGPGGVGADMIQALRTAEGSIFFVDRGWVPVESSALEHPDEVFAGLPPAPMGEVTVEARLRAGEPEISGRSTSGSTVASIDLPELARLAGDPSSTYTGAYGMLISETPAAEQAFEHGQLPSKPERDEGPHLSYALQWYVFILIAGIGVAYAARQEYRSLNAGNDTVRRQDRRSAERRRRRGPSDADEEDALLDG
ncbi:SURF1 family protein [Leucobacter sp. CSA1]|uniref:SURF1-like protein n=1 Tax=Leucobacter chromiisoli TaxID=2796471 RepID=A0A934Q6I5_9MICO|nr:SURF1 family protein [Leucobacter chromiisoli]MBK0417976.1 SURF1 family protein [Leucobacter chromiisoli]